jgi:hypothetical protein
MSIDTTFASFLVELNVQNVEGVVALFCADSSSGAKPSLPYVGLTTEGPSFKGAKEITDLFQSLFTAFPDLKFAPLGVLHSSELPTKIVVQATLNGTHKGVWSPSSTRASSPINNVSATNLPFQVPACAIFSFDDNFKITTLGVYFDRYKIIDDLKIPSKP